MNIRIKRFLLNVTQDHDLQKEVMKTEFNNKLTDPNSINLVKSSEGKKCTLTAQMQARLERKSGFLS